MFKFISVLLFSITLSACSNFQLSSNLDKDNFKESTKAAKVKVYKASDLTKLEYDFIEAVEGSSCQKGSNEIVANEIDARTNARRVASDLGANGVVFQTCIVFPKDNVCISNIICYAKAIKVSE